MLVDEPVWDEAARDEAVWDEAVRNEPVRDEAVWDEAVWDEELWTRRRDAHHARVDAWLAPQRERRARGIAHPVEDFLFDYYSFRPYQLRRWHPGHGVLLGGPAAQELLSWPHYVRSGAGVTVATESLVAARAATLRWVYDLLVGTAGRTGFFGCFGMHEWAMVYRLPGDELRHAGWPLRFDEAEVAQIVQERDVRCTHFDAFRFFTAAARPLNALQPSRETQPDLEQPGCLHTGMDLYKHAYKLSPLVPSDLVANTFALARDIRELDMRASPYDLTALGLEPVPVETSEGRADYARRQRRFAERSAPLRQALIDVITPLVPPPAADERAEHHRHRTVVQPPLSSSLHPPETGANPRRACGCARE